jgi:hypothetical protein
MNPNNYASLEASKRLVETGIVIETEAGWYKIFRPGCHSFDMVLSMRSGNEKFYGDNYPAPSMAEVWRELPDIIKTDHGLSFLSIRKVVSHADDLTYINAEYDQSPNSFVRNDNPTDALIDLLIWVRKEASHE